MALDFSKLRAIPYKGNNAQGEANDNRITAIETEYKGYRFRSRREAKWAVFFDACGVKWEYELEGYECSNGVRYLPDFLLHDVHVMDGEEEIVIDLFVEVKKDNPTEYDGKKVESLRHGSAIINIDSNYGNAIVVLGNIPEGGNIPLLKLHSLLQYSETQGTTCPMWSLAYVTGRDAQTLPAIGLRGEFILVAESRRGVDEVRTVEAYDKARQSQFEFGKTPRPETRTVTALHLKAKENLSGVIVLDAIENFVPADFCAPSPVGTENYYSEFFAVTKIRRTLRRLAMSKVTRWLFVGDNMVNRWGAIADEYLFMLRGDDLCGTAFKTFESLILSGFVSPRIQRQTFWNKFLLEHATRCFSAGCMHSAEQLLARKPEEDPVAATLYKRVVEGLDVVMFKYLKFARFEPTTGVLTVEYPKGTVKYLNAIEKRRAGFENALSRAFGMPVLLDMHLKDE